MGKDAGGTCWKILKVVLHEFCPTELAQSYLFYDPVFINLSGPFVSDKS